MPSFYRIAALVAASSGTLSAVILSQSDKFKAYASSYNEKVDYAVEVKQGKRRHSSWNSNWDKMAQKPKVDKEGETPRSTASRTSHSYPSMANTSTGILTQTRRS